MRRAAGRRWKRAGRPAAGAGGRGGASGRGDALRGARRRQAAAGVPGDGECGAVRRVADLRRARRRRRSRWCTPIRWCTTICRRWTTTICGAASRRAHKAFDEATAILAGDALLTRAFEVLAEPDTHGDPEARCELVAALGGRGRRARHGAAAR